MIFSSPDIPIPTLEGDGGKVRKVRVHKMERLFVSKAAESTRV